MAVTLSELYRDISSRPEYEVTLCTESCFDRVISWTHILEDTQFISVLRGDELVLNSGLAYTSDDWIRGFVDLLNEKGASGLIVAFRSAPAFSREIIDYCNEIRFPLFSATWKTSYMDIMRLFSTKLLENEQTETNLITAFKNAIDYPGNRDLYQPYFEEAGYQRNMDYTVAMLSCHTYNTAGGNATLEQSHKSLRRSLKQSIVYEKNRILTILAAGHRREEVLKEIGKLCAQDDNICAGVGTTVLSMEDIRRSCETANTAYQLTKTGINKNFLDYDNLGVYKILSDIRDARVYPAFVEETLGPLLRHDRENHTDYLHILEAYFEHECSIINTADALYCHKNTMAYKLNRIREILGFDILTNENRTKIMLSFCILRLGNEYFFE